MARILGLLNDALAAARAGKNATEFYKDLKARGIAPRQSEAYALFAQAKGIVEDTGAEAFRSMQSVPTANELRQWPTRGATGVNQRILILHREKGTGAVIQSYYTVSSATGVTREEAVNTAIEAYRSNNERYNTETLGAVHVAAYQLTPFRAS